MLERLSVAHNKKSKPGFTIWACPQVAAAVLKPYNAVLCLHSLEHTEVTSIYNNEALYDTCRRNLAIPRASLIEPSVASQGPVLVPSQH